MRFLKSNSLAIVLALLFLGSVGGQSYAGWKTYDSEQQAHHEATISYPRYLVLDRSTVMLGDPWQEGRLVEEVRRGV